MEKLIVNFYNVEHGDCTHIITPNGTQILIDVGSRSDRSVVDYIRGKYYSNLTDKRIDAFILTHTHEDHMEDLPNLMLRLKPRVIDSPKEAFDLKEQEGKDRYNQIVRKANEMNRTYSAPVLDSVNPINPRNNGGVSFKVIRCRELFDESDANYYSCIVVMQYQGYKFVFTGDNPKQQLEKMIESNFENISKEVKGALVLVAPHHGRMGEFCDRFVEIVNPCITVVSDGTIKCNSQKGTAALYEGYSRGIIYDGVTRKVFTTRKDGNITFEIWHDERIGTKYCVCCDREDY